MTDEKKDAAGTPSQPPQQQQQSPPQSPQQAAAEAAGASSPTSTWGLRATLLALLAAQTSAHTLIVRYSRGVLHEKFSPAAVVLCVEFLKLAACACAVAFFPRAVSPSTQPGIRRIPRLVLETPPLILVPAASFFVQNNLAFVALRHLTPSVFIVLSQLKIVATTVFSTLVLRRRFSQGHWRALVLLIFASILVDPSSASTAASATTATEESAGSTVVGVAAVLCMAALSGFSSVVLEFVLKGTPSVTIWERNLQLASCSIVIAMLTVSANRAFGDVVAIASFKSGVTLAAALVSAFGGIVVASVMRYADNVVKCFATAVGICLTSALSVLIFHENASRLLLIGIGLVVLSILNYNAEPPAQSPSPHAQQSPLVARIQTIAASESWRTVYIAALAAGAFASIAWSFMS